MLAILEAAFLNIGVFPNYMPVEEVLGRVTALGGRFESHVAGDFYRLSLHNLLRAAYHNIPDNVAHRPGIKAHLLGIIEARVPDLSLELGASSSFALQVLSNGGGSVKILPLGALCAASCKYTFLQGESISLTPVADEGYEFSHWETDCSGTEGRCDLLMEDQKTASAVFKPSEQESVFYSFSMNISGAGQVVDQNSSSLCAGEGCNYLLEQGQAVMLLASANDGYQFDGWSGDCSGTASCSLSFDSNKAVTAHFSPILLQLTLEFSGQGGVSSTSGLSCSSSPCQFSLPLGETVSLLANPSSGFQLDSWGGACSGKLTCAVNMDSNKRVVADFSPILHTLTVSVSEGGAVASLAADLNCYAGVCSTQVQEGKKITLSALSSDGYDFESWSGQCAGSSADCSIIVESDVGLSVNFSSMATQTGLIPVMWSAPVEREDGSPLSPGDIKSYTIYYSQTSGVYSDAITVVKRDDGSVPTSARLQSLEKGSTYYIAGITVDTNGASSQLSNEIVKIAE